MDKIIKSFFKKEFLFLLLAIFLFLFLRLPSLHLPYHQDEVKWVANSISSSGQISTGMGQLPLVVVIFKYAGMVLGADYFRLLPILFGIVNLFLLFWLTKINFGEKAALWSTFIFAAVFYNILASLTIDIDGQILPLFFLLSALAYYKQKKTGSWRWRILLVLFLIGGALLKFSFVLVIAALAADFIVENRAFITPRRFIIGLSVFLAFCGFVALMFLKARFIFPNFDITSSLNHVKDFVRLSGRNYFQVFYQLSKAIIYSSPILILPPIFLKKEDFYKLKLFIAFLVFGLLFYLVVFDFSSGALDKYLSFIIAPLAIMGGVALSKIFESPAKINRAVLMFGILITAALFMSQFLPQNVPPLYPKTEWIARATHFKWNFLVPFTGGSGPLGFYMSWLFIILTWVVSLVLISASFLKTNLGKTIVLLVVLLSISYNFAFAEELSYGKINGNAAQLLSHSIEFIKTSKNIDKVMSYNDIGGFYLGRIGKYERRIFVAPKYDNEYKKILNGFKKYYLVINIPRLSPDSIYAKFFGTCVAIYEESSKMITAKVYDCKNAINL